MLDREERVDGFRLLGPTEAQDFFQALSALDQSELVLSLSSGEQRLWLRSLAPDDAADLVQEAPEDLREALLVALEEPTRREVRTLLAYAEDDAGGLMSPRFARVRPEMTVDEAILYLRRQATQHLETIYYAYVLDREQKLLGVVSFRDLFQARGVSRVSDVMSSRADHRAGHHGPGAGRPRHRDPRPDRDPRRRRGRAHGRHRDRRRHRRRGAGGGHRGHPQDRRLRGPRRAVPRGRPGAGCCRSARAG